MSSRFMIEMPKRRPSAESFFMILSGSLFMAGPLIALGSVIGDPRIPFTAMGLLVLSAVVGVVMGFMFIRSEIRKQRTRRAESHLKSAVQRMGYVALEPIEVHGTRDRVLLKDEEGPALWDVSFSGNTVVCAKRI